MKTRFLSGVMLLLLIGSFSSLWPQDQTSYLEKLYFGALYMGSMSGSYYNFQNDIFSLAGAKVKFPIASGHLRSRLLYNFRKPGAHFWWMKDFSSFEINVGYFSRPVAIINRPEPVSSAGHFEPPSKGIIPGPAFGVLGKINSEKFGSDLMFGLYQTSKNLVEFNFGVQRNTDWFIFQKVGISGYYANESKNGIVLNAELGKLSLMVFRGSDISSVKTYSGFAHFALADSAGIFADIIHQQEKLQKIEIGIYKMLSEKISVTEVKYLLGASYCYSEVKPNSVNFYLQIWWDK